jgi:tetratricopeptide (TPR) repeat protein
LISVSLANLDGDTDLSVTKLVFDSLNEVRGIHAYLLNRRITVTEINESDDGKKAFDLEAQRYLKETGARIMLWGKVVRRAQENSVPKLYWTVKNSDGRNFVNNYAPNPDNRLPAVFASDMGHALELLFYKEANDSEAPGAGWSDTKIEDFIQRLSRVADFESPVSDSCPATSPPTNLWVMLADSELELAYRKSDFSAAAQAMQIYKAAAFYYTCEHSVVLTDIVVARAARAATLMSGLMGEIGDLNDAVDTLQRQINESRKTGPGFLTMMRAALCSARTMKGQLPPLVANGAEQSVELCGQVLEETPPNLNPLAWANSQIALGDAWFALAVVRNDTSALRSAIVAYHAALTVETFEKYPHNWAQIQFGLAQALFASGDGIQALQSASASRNAMKVWRDVAPILWARASLQLCASLAAYGVAEKNVKLLDEGLAACKQSLSVLQTASLELHATALVTTGVVAVQIAYLHNNATDLREARQLILESQALTPRNYAPVRWAAQASALCVSDLAMSQLDDPQRWATIAISDCRDAIAARPREGFETYWYQDKINIAQAMLVLASQRPSTASYRDAIRELTDAQEQAIKNGDRRRAAVLSVYLYRAKTIGPTKVIKGLYDNLSFIEYYATQKPSRNGSN